MTSKMGSLTGERLGKEYRDRYANFSKGAHFVFGSQGKKNYQVKYFLSSSICLF